MKEDENYRRGGDEDNYWCEPYGGERRQRLRMTHPEDDD